MKGRAMIAAAAMLAAGSAGAQPPSRQDLFCAELKRVIDVAELDGDFTYLERSRAAPPRLGFRHCFAAAAARPAWYCHQNLAPAELGLVGLAERTAACLPNAVRTRGPYDGRQAIFTLPRARILIEESGGPGAHVGLIATFRVESVRPAE